jgi:hypothetical protein
MKKLIYISIVLILTACGSKKSLERTEIKTDSTYINSLLLEIKTLKEKETKETKELTTITKPSNSDIEIDNPCDSVTGLLRDLKTKAGNTTVKSENGKLKIVTKCPESIESLLSINQKLERQLELSKTKVDTVFLEATSDVKIEDKKTIYRTPLWAWITIPTLIILCLFLAKKAYLS